MVLGADFRQVFHRRRRWPAFAVMMLIFGFSFVLINVLVDIIYMLVDPRVRFG